MRRRLAAAVVATAAAASVALVAPSSQAATPLQYVAMGDSYSAASGNVPPDPTAAPQCLRSLVNYPHDIAARTNVRLTDVTCGGADTSDYTTSQYQGVPPQVNALSKSTQLVTMTIGGNDSNVFINSIIECGAAGLSTAGQGHPCKDRYGSSFEDTIRNKTKPSLIKALRKVHHDATNARVAILGYPWILPAKDGCFDKMPVAKGDVPYLRHVQWTLNDVIQEAAELTGTIYVNFNKTSNGHDACKDLGVRWIEPVLQGVNPVIVHPNALGESQMAAQTIKRLGLR